MHANALKRHREYELVYLLTPSTTPGSAEKVGDSIREVIESKEGKLLKVDLWGIRSLAYRIRGNKQGIYYYMRFVTTQGAVEEMERRLKITDSVLRFLTVRRSVHEVDPSTYTVREDEARFKGIEDLQAGIQAGEEAAEGEPAGEGQGEGADRADAGEGEPGVEVEGEAASNDEEEDGQ
jgi:small subunit ribosomal protein S6